MHNLNSAKTLFCRKKIEFCIIVFVFCRNLQEPLPLKQKKDDQKMTALFFKKFSINVSPQFVLLFAVH